MKILPFNTFCISMIIFFSSSMLNNLEAQTKYEDIGVIKQSILKPTQFNKTQNGVWVLLDGSKISQTTELFELLKENFDLDILTLKEDGNYYLPNASGAFIRSSNVNGEGYDPDKSRKIGSIQKDTIKSHSVESEKAYFGHRNDGFPRQDDHDPGNWVGRLKVKSDYIGATETRPINISMYTYIKISD